MLRVITNGLDMAKQFANSLFAEAPDTMGEEQLRKIEYTVATRDIVKSRYEHGDPRHYLAAMLAARLPGSAVVAAFAKDIPRFTKIIDLEKNIEIESSQRTKYINDYLENIALQTNTDLNNILPIVSHLSQGHMAEVHAVISQKFKFPLSKLTIMPNDPKPHWNLILNGTCISLHHDVYFYNANETGLELSDEDFTKLYINKEKHIKISTITTIDLADLKNNPVLQTVTVEELRDNLTFNVTSLIKAHESNSAEFETEYIMVAEALPPIDYTTATYDTFTPIFHRRTSSGDINLSPRNRDEAELQDEQRPASSCMNTFS